MSKSGVWFEVTLWSGDVVKVKFINPTTLQFKEMPVTFNENYRYLNGKLQVNVAIARTLVKDTGNFESQLSEIRKGYDK